MSVDPNCPINLPVVALNSAILEVSKLVDFTVFDSPSGLATNNTHVAVADSANHRVSIFTVEGKFTGFEEIDGMKVPFLFTYRFGMGSDLAKMV